MIVALRGRGFLERLFQSAGQRAWRLYALCAAAQFLGLCWLYGLDITPPEGAYAQAFFYALPAFAAAGFALLFIALLRTYEKAAADYELAFAQQALDAGRAYYESLTDTLEQVRHLRHDHHH